MLSARHGAGDDESDISKSGAFQADRQDRGQGQIVIMVRRFSDLRCKTVRHPGGRVHELLTNGK